LAKSETTRSQDCYNWVRSPHAVSVQRSDNGVCFQSIQMGSILIESWCHTARRQQSAFQDAPASSLSHTAAPKACGLSVAPDLLQIFSILFENRHLTLVIWNVCLSNFRSHTHMTAPKPNQPGRSFILAIFFALGALISMLMVFGMMSARHQSTIKIRSEKILADQLPELGGFGNYSSSDTCKTCHPDEHASWMRTFHRSMTMLPVEGNVLGDFSGQTISSEGLDYTVTQTNQTYWANMPDPDLLMQAVQGGKGGDLTRIPHVNRQVVLTTGSHHYQTYWVESPRMDNILQTLPLVYLIKDQRWIPREAAFMRGPDDQERMVTQWNHHCIRCHSTGWNPGLNDKTGMLETKVAELGISCEACHGPGKEHIAFHQNPIHRYQTHLGSKDDTTIVNPAKLNHERSSHVCGQCHGVFIPNNRVGMKIAHEGVQFKPGDNLFDTRYYIHYPKEGDPPERWDELEKNPQFFQERWWEDGTILAGGREFTAMSSSECYLSGKMSCLSCHSMHQSPPKDQLKSGMDSNQACVQCHQEAKYNDRISEHTFHAPDSSGSDCLNCHMPHTTYALFGAIRSHEMKSPKLQGSAVFGVPNACNLCHLDKTLEWTQTHMMDRYNAPSLSLTDEQKSVSAALLWMLKGHAAQRAIVAWHMGWKPAQEISGVQWMPPFLSQLLMDPYPVVRYIGRRSLESAWPNDLPPFDFMDEYPVRLESYRNTMEMWKQKNLFFTKNAALLMDDSGKLSEEPLRRLLRQRDNRSVSIKE